MGGINNYRQLDAEGLNIRWTRSAHGQAAAHGSCSLEGEGSGLSAPQGEETRGGPEEAGPGAAPGSGGQAVRAPDLHRESL